MTAGDGSHHSAARPDLAGLTSHLLPAKITLLICVGSYLFLSPNGDEH